MLTACRACADASAASLAFVAVASLSPSWSGSTRLGGWLEGGGGGAWTALPETAPIELIVDYLCWLCGLLPRSAGTLFRLA